MPADTPLQATLALVGWKKVEDLSGDGGVIKKTLHDPEGWQVGCLLRVGLPHRSIASGRDPE